jgi:hypothetical protein
MKHKYFLSAPLLLLISFFLLCSELGKGKEIPPCTCSPQVYYEREKIREINQDTAIVFDTCGLKIKYNSCDSTFVQNLYRSEGIPYYDSTIKKVFAKYYWDIYFLKDAIKLPVYPHDTAIYVTWEAIDTSSVLERKIFRELDSIFGKYKLKKISPEIDTGSSSRGFDLYFDNWVSVVEVEKFINDNLFFNLNNDKRLCYCEFKRWPFLTAGNSVPDESQSPYNLSLNTGNTNLHISSNAEPIINYAIYNLQGNAISQLNNINHQNALDNDISSLSNGIYFLRINTHISKFIINR